MTSLKQSPYGEALDFGDEIDWEPHRLVFPGPWAGHLPFARWLIKACRPNVLVELGTHTGNSFSAFCQSIQACAAPTRAFAVDSWMGDEHAGYYGDDVYNELKAFTDARYSQFATLLRSTFDEALSQFMPGTIDILHIDGMHTYEAVKHDFLTWYDMLSERAIVLFHDTNVHEREFGVWKLWEELSARHPAFEFKHSNGLGVLGVGSDLPRAMKAFFESVTNEETATDIAAFFATKGRPLELSTDIIALRRDVSKLSRELDEAKDYQRGLEETLRTLSAEKGQTDQMLAERSQALEQTNIALTQVMGERNHLAEAVHNIHRSTSWRVTRPLRLASRLYRNHGTPYVNAVRRRLRGGSLAEIKDGQPVPATDRASLRDAVRTVMRSRLDAFLNSEATLKLPSALQPDVSIILVLYNQAEMTYACLAAIKECLENSAVRIETILLDNGSRDETHALLQRIEGAKIIRNGQNLHFLRGVNAAAAQASGRHILLLNNDAQITQGSLEMAVQMLDADPTIGAVGARIILPDGTLQEAGSIIWADGSCLGYGRGRKPDDAEFMFRRDVDYCSGAFLLTPKALFERLGCLDEIYAPAYYEETDYCVRVWKENLRVVYDPRIVIHHFEFASSGQVSDALQLQERNQSIFRERHAEWLARQFTPKDNLYLARHHAPRKPRILFVEDRVPKGWLGAGFPRAADIVQEFVRQGLQVTLFTTAGRPEKWHEVWKAQPAEVEVVLPHVEGFDLRQFLVQRKGSFDGIFVTRPHNMQKLRAVLDREPDLKGQAKLIYDAEALFANREILKKEIDGTPLSKQAQEKLIRDEVLLASGSDLVLSVSNAEKQAMLDTGLPNVQVLGHKLELDPTETSFEARRNIVFLGAIHDDDTPNADSVRWFADDILPELRRLLGRNDLKLTVVGLVQAPSLQAMAGDRLDLLGRVDDLKAVLETARLVVVPTRFAAGIPHKVHHVASFGVPVVATDLIVEQLAWTPGRDILAASDPARFARHCCDLYSDPELWKQVRENALIRVEQDCSVSAFENTIAGLVALVGQSRPA